MRMGMASTTLPVTGGNGKLSGEQQKEVPCQDVQE